MVGHENNSVVVVYKGQQMLVDVQDKDLPEKLKYPWCVYPIKVVAI